MSKKEVEAVKQLYRAELSNFPKIYDSDPVVKAINAKVGDLLKIKRSSPTAGTTTYYRQVISTQESIQKTDPEKSAEKETATKKDKN